MTTKAEKDLWVEMSIREIWTQAHFAEITYSHISPKATNGNDAVFSSIHSFLSHCAIISKMLKANDDSNPPKSIGYVLGISDISLIHRRKFRNNLEHYDKELKKWIRKFGANVNIGTYNMGPKNAFQIPNMVFVSHYDQTDQTFTFVNEDFDLAALFTEVQRIKSIADNWVNGMEIRKINPPFI
mgnify:FL=1